MNERDAQIQLSAELQTAIELSAELQAAIEQYEAAYGMFVADIRIHRTGPILVGVGIMTTVNKQWKVEPELQQS